MLTPNSGHTLDTLNKNQKNATHVNTFFNTEPLTPSEKKELIDTLNGPIKLINRYNPNEPNIEISRGTLLLSIKKAITETVNKPTQMELVGGWVKQLLTPGYKTEDIDIAITIDSDTRLDRGWIHHLICNLLKNEFGIESPEQWFGLSLFTSTNVTPSGDIRAVIKFGDNTDITLSHYRDYAFKDKARRIPLYGEQETPQKITAKKVGYLAPRHQVQLCIADNTIDSGDFTNSWDKVPKCFHYLSRGGHYINETEALLFYQSFAQYLVEVFHDIHSTQRSNFRKLQNIDRKILALDPTALFHGIIDIESRWPQLTHELSADQISALERYQKQCIHQLTRRPNASRTLTYIADKMLALDKRALTHFVNDWNRLVALTATLDFNNKAPAKRIEGSADRFSYHTKLYNEANTQQEKDKRTGITVYAFIDQSREELIHSLYNTPTSELRRLQMLADELRFELNDLPNQSMARSTVTQKPIHIRENIRSDKKQVEEGYQSSLPLSPPPSPSTTGIFELEWLGKKATLSDLKNTDTLKPSHAGTETNTETGTLTVDFKRDQKSQTAGTSGRYLFQTECTFTQGKLQPNLASATIAFENTIYKGEVHLKIVDGRLKAIKPNGYGTLDHPQLGTISGQFFPNGLLHIEKSSKLSPLSGEILVSNWIDWLSVDRGVELSGKIQLEVGSASDQSALKKIEFNGELIVAPKKHEEKALENRHKKPCIDILPVRCRATVVGSTASMAVESMLSDDQREMAVVSLTESYGPFQLQLIALSVTQRPIIEMTLQQGDSNGDTRTALKSERCEIQTPLSKNLPERLYLLLTDDLSSVTLKFSTSAPPSNSSRHAPEEVKAEDNLGYAPIHHGDSLIFKRNDGRLEYFSGQIEIPHNEPSLNRLQRRDKYGNTLNFSPTLRLHKQEGYTHKVDMEASYYGRNGNAHLIVEQEPSQEKRARIQRFPLNWPVCQSSHYIKERQQQPLQLPKECILIFFCR